MELMDVFEVVINSDSIEGRGRDYVCARFFKEHEAELFAKGRDVMGTDGKVQKGQVVAVSTSSGEKFYPVGSEVSVFLSTEHKARMEALNKLTIAERKLFGLA